ncbi:TolC family protein [Mucilaginibacter celer]|uniref:TolC family protein n=1 Tax=Mucilaginibacter celer TaxID=2305508 RepID=A0A494VSJ3_9SPHI|nr:TolC family protein [Mucilaginibacter celer]AYL94323.1 TolC family protein [Mucilaginibacter celer]
MKKLLAIGLIVCFNRVIAQDTVVKVLPLTELFQLTEVNSRQLQASKQNVGINEARTEIARSQKLPDIETSAEAGYLSTITILNPNFSWYANVETPHFVNNYFLGASETLYKGGSIRLNIKKGELGEQLAALNYEKDRQDIKLLLLGRYLELFQQYNNRLIYRENIRLAKKRLDDLNKLKRQGLVTQNDIIRNELLLSDFQLDLQQVENNITILNKELQVVLGLPERTRILPDTTLTSQPISVSTLTDYSALAQKNQPAIQSSRISEQIAGKNVAIEKAARLPELSVYAGDALQRPFLNTLEPLNIYYNAYQAGFKLKYNISSIYHARDRIKLARLEQEQQKAQTAYREQQAEIEVTTAFTRYQEARERAVTLSKSLDLANDNFRVVEKKYINQLAQVTDMLDASTAKLSAELRLNNEKINIINQWFRLQKAAGNF